MDSEVQNENSQKEKSARRIWLLVEDRYLTDSLLQMHREGKLRCEGGFRARYLQVLEKEIASKLPASGITAKNIDLRLSYLKRQFFALLEIKEKGSGFGWDDELKMVTGDKIIFDEWSKSHKFAKGLYRKPWPLFDDFKEIFAKDRANGSVAASLDEEREALESQVNFMSYFTSEESVDPVNITPTNTSSSKKAPTKRKLEEIESVQANLVNKIEKVTESGNDQLAQILEIVTSEEKVDKARLHLELSVILGLSIVHVQQHLRTMTVDDANTFYAVQTKDEKYAFVQIVLGFM